MKRKTIAALLVIAMIMGLSAPAYAVDTPTEVPEQTQEQPQPQEPEQEETPVVVSTLEELQAAVTAAEGGDTIAVSAEIMLDGVALETDKDITLVRADTYESGSFFRLKNGALISGFTIENYKSSTTVVCESSAEIEDCCFIGDSDSSETFIKLYALSTSNVVCISYSSFSGAAYSAIHSKNNVQLTITDCTFSDI